MGRVCQKTVENRCANAKCFLWRLFGTLANHSISAGQVVASRKPLSATETNYSIFCANPYISTHQNFHGGITSSDIVEKGGAGGANCNFDTKDGPDYIIINSNHRPCTRPCTQAHEEQHKNDRIACCRKARERYFSWAAFFNRRIRDEVKDKWAQFIQSSRGWSECRAYGASVKCAKEQMEKNSCCLIPADNYDPVSSDSSCCKDLKYYFTRAIVFKVDYCSKAGPAPTCPDF